MAQGVAILGMLCLHLFCRTGELPYTPLIWLGERPLIYYIGLFGDLCVPVFCFCSGYAQSLLYEKTPHKFLKNSLRRISKFISHFWIVVCLFSAVGLAMGHTAIPGNLSSFIGNMLLYDLSYNGAWWFVVTYILLIPLTPFFEWCLNGIQPVFVVLGSGILYVISYVFRFALILNIPNSVLSWWWNQMILLGMSQFSFVVGIVFQKYSVMDYLLTRKRCSPKRYAAAIVILPMLMFLLHCIEPSLIIAPLTGLITIICLNLWKKPVAVKRFFGFMGRHSTNLWLVHMFVYMTMFPELVFASDVPVVILLVLLLVCILTSYLVDGIETAIYKLTGRMIPCVLKTQKKFPQYWSESYA